MATDFWGSSHYRRWIVDRATVRRAREEDLRYVDDPQYLQYLAIYFANAITKLGKKLGLRQRVIATATVFFRRFYLKNSYCETDPSIVIAACCYVAAKAEESPVHIKTVISEARSVFNNDLYAVRNFPTENTKLAEMEFYLVDDLECDLTVFHPYRTLLALCKKEATEGMTPADISDETEAGEVGVGIGLDDGPRYWGTGEGRLELSTGALQTAWFIINDTYRSDLCLLYPPHLIAISAIYLTFILYTPQRSIITPLLPSSSTPSSPPMIEDHPTPTPSSSTHNPHPTLPLGINLPPKPLPFSQSQPRRSSRNTTTSTTSTTTSTNRNPSNTPTPPSHSYTTTPHRSVSSSSFSQQQSQQISGIEIGSAQDPIQFLADLNVSLPLIATISQEIISLYTLWDNYKEDVQPEGKSKSKSHSSSHTHTHTNTSTNSPGSLASSPLTSLTTTVTPKKQTRGAINVSHTHLSSVHTPTLTPSTSFMNDMDTGLGFGSGSGGGGGVGLGLSRSASGSGGNGGGGGSGGSGGGGVTATYLTSLLLRMRESKLMDVAITSSGSSSSSSSLTNNNNINSSSSSSNMGGMSNMSGMGNMNMGGIGGGMKNKLMMSIPMPMSMSIGGGGGGGISGMSGMSGIGTMTQNMIANMGAAGGNTSGGAGGGGGRAVNKMLERTQAAG